MISKTKPTRISGRWVFAFFLLLLLISGCQCGMRPDRPWWRPGPGPFKPKPEPFRPAPHHVPRRGEAPTTEKVASTRGQCYTCTDPSLKCKCNEGEVCVVKNCPCDGHEAAKK